MAFATIYKTKKQICIPAALSMDLSSSKRGLGLLTCHRIAACSILAERERGRRLRKRELPHMFYFMGTEDYNNTVILYSSF
jgi:hypothetical protein